MALTEQNYSRGFLVDQELMGGVSEDPERPGHYFAFVLRHTTGEYLGYQPFETLADAITAINGVERNWVFEAVKGKCGGSGRCGAGGCGGGGCR